MDSWSGFIIASFLRVHTLDAYMYEAATGQNIFWSDFTARTILLAILIVIIYMKVHR